MASAGFAACMGADPETVLQAAEIGIGEAPLLERMETWLTVT